MKITAVIPAYNEEKTIKEVATIVNRHRLVDEVIVVSDGSTDNTVKIATKIGVKVIDLTTNKGKGAAMKAGVEQSQADIILFLDADLLGLKEEHIDKLLIPVIKGDAETTIGIFAEGRMFTDLAQKIAPFLSGQRVVRRRILDDIPDLDMTRFGVEMALTQHIKGNNIRLKEVVLEDLSHVMKEEKRGFIKGFMSRLKMYWEILKNLSTTRKVR
ncbi:glycosyl transferase family 2 [Orenia metallireducens]|uniref:Glucosyl-3-phosphoglycerate synthase n=1 Tax=Orenia metallireducens TaxID=1413210 RepID=A0A285FNH4_9FIRM|nr:glycosyltransferase family 2 protein [Orenia metallireducens]PRX33630.1 glycosyl transferase family 2 [Orenia metallireducens]SNY12404.1 Glycosyl transferase family 2 [Orenia metallireducens]